MNFIYHLVELLKQLGLLFLQILELLMLDLILPLNILVLCLSYGNLALSLLQLHLHVVTLVSLLLKELDLFLQSLHWLDDIVVGLLLQALVLVCLVLILQMCLQILSQGLDHVQVGPRDLTIVLLDVVILLLMLLLEGLDGCVLLGLNLLNLFLPLLLHVLAQESHLILVFELDLVSDSLLLLPDSRGLRNVVLHQSILVVFLAGLLLFLLDF